MPTRGPRRWPGMLAVLLMAALYPVITPSIAGAAPRSASVGISDDFEAPNIDPDTWTLVDPTGQGQASIALGSLVFAPGGDSWQQDDSTRVEQEVEDDDFEVTLEVPALPGAPYSAVGTTFLGETSWLRIGFTGTVDGAAIVAIAGNGGAPLIRLNQPVGPDTTRLRVRRLGPQYLVWSASSTGDWRFQGSLVEPLVVQRLALFGAGREPYQPVAISDFSATEPVPDRPTDTTGPLIHGVTTRPVGNDLVVSFFTDEKAVGSIAVEGADEPFVGLAELVLQHEITVPDVENGSTVTIRPVARDEAGNMSEGPAVDVRFTEEGLPVIDVWYGDRQTFGRNGVPQGWVNILGNVSDEDGIVSLNYQLDDRDPKPLSIGPSERRLAMPGDFNADIAFDDLAAGEHTVEIRATDTLGNLNTRSVTVVIAQTLPPEIPHEVVWAEAAESSLNNIAQVVDGKWEVQPDGTLRTVEIGYDRVVAVGDRRWSDYEVEFPVTIHDVSPEGYGAIDGKPSIGVTVGWTGHFVWDDTQPAYGFWPATGAGGLYWETLDEVKMTVLGNNGVPAQSTPSVNIPLDSKVRMRIRVEQLTEGPRISMKAWGDGGIEPAEWAVFVTDDDDTNAGSVALVAHHTDVSIGDVTVHPLSP